MLINEENRKLRFARLLAFLFGVFTVGLVIYMLGVSAPNHQRKKIVYEIYVDCIQKNTKEQCAHILKKLESNALLDEVTQ